MKSTSAAIAVVTNLSLKLQYRILLVSILRSPIMVRAIRIDIFSTDEKVETITDAITKMGLFFKELPKGHDTNKIASFAISKSAKAVLLYSDAAGKAKPDYMEMLRLAGLPETAVKASTNLDDQLPEDEYPDDLRIILHHPLIFTLSKEGQKEEIALIRRWLRDIRVYTPLLHQQAKREFEPKVDFM